MSSPLKLVVKPTSGGDKINVEVEANITVLELKEEIQKTNGLAAAEQRLIYKGQILRDERTLDSYGIGNEHVLHLVKGRPAGGDASSTPSAAAPAPAGVPGAASPASTAGRPAAADPMAGMQQVLSQAMNNPMFQSMFNDPELVRSMLQSNPMVRELVDRNPELAQMLNDPAILRQTLQMASNPNLMREHMRNADRTLSNIEAMPEGFNTLRRIYENVQEPLMNATTPGGLFGAAAAGNGAGAATTTSATTTQQASSTGAAPDSAAASATPNSNPLPNPWGPAPASNATGGAAPPADPLGLGGLGLGGLGGPFGGMPGLGGAGGMPDMNQMMQMMQSPLFQQMSQSLMSQPGFMESMINSNPQLRSMVEGNPMMRSMLSNPDFIRQMMNPDNVRMMMQMQQALGGANAFPGMAAVLGGAHPAGTAAPGSMPDLSAMLNSLSGLGMGGLGGLGGLGAFGGAPPAVADPETAYAGQLQQLQDMGFFDRAQNIRALQATGGNVSAAVERLLSGG